MLHNICKIRGDAHAPTLTRLEELRYNAAVQQEREFQDLQQRGRRLPNTIPNEMLKLYFENVANERQQQ